MVEALAGSDADLAATRVVCDWIQYKANFRETVMVRPVLSADGSSAVDGYELAVDLRRCARPETDVAAEVTAALAEAVHVSRGPVSGSTAAGADGPRAEEYRAGEDKGGAGDRAWLEPWVPGSASCVWRFNALYWQALADWEKVTGKEYE